MKARQSKAAREVFSSESNGRAVIREIHKVSADKARTVASVKVGKDHWRVKEL